MDRAAAIELLGELDARNFAPVYRIYGRVISIDFGGAVVVLP